MVMDWVRVCYQTKMQLWRDSDTLTPVRWFRADPAAKVWDKVQRFGSQKTYRRGEPLNTGVGERPQFFTYDKGKNVVGYRGQTHCGSDNAMQFGGIRGRDPELTTGPNGDLPCCKTMPPICDGAPWPGPVVLCLLTVTDSPGCECLDGLEVPMVWDIDRLTETSQEWVGPTVELPGCPTTLGNPSRLTLTLLLGAGENACAAPRLRFLWEDQDPPTGHWFPSQDTRLDLFLVTWDPLHFELNIGDHVDEFNNGQMIDFSASPPPNECIAFRGRPGNVHFLVVPSP